MSDVGLDADLSLDVRQALEQVRRVERALDQATTGVTVLVRADTAGMAGEVESAVDAADTTVVVTGEAADLTGDVTAAIDAADTTATVTGDASQLTGEVTSAVDEGDSTVIVTGDASQLTGAVTSAVDAADTTVSVTADPSGLEAAGQAADGLNASLIASSQSGLNLRAVLATGFAAAAVAGMVSLVNAASELEQSVGGTNAIFGEFEGTVSSFARGAAEAAGLSEEAARRLTSQIGGLLQGFGFTQQEAAETSVVLAQLGADLAATFGGNPEEAVQALGAALRGEFDPLERFGVSLNVTQANLKAVELGLATNKDSVDLNARAQASLALIMERSAQAQGQFGREVNTTSGQLERARAELTNTAASIGATLQPTINELLAAVRADLIPALGDLGTTLGPSLIRLVGALLPAFGTFTSILISLEPVISAVATVLDTIPAPVIAMIGTFLAFRQVAGPVGTVLTQLATGLVNLIVPSQAVAGITAEVGKQTATASRGFAGMVAAINPVTAVLAAGAIAFSLYAQQQAEAAAEQRAMEAQSSSFRDALTSTEGSIAGVTEQLRGLIDSGEGVEVMLGGLQLSGVKVDEVFKVAGISAQQFARGLADAEQPLDDVATALERSDREGAAFAATTLRDLSRQYQESAQAALDAGVATEDWTEAQVRAATEQTRNADGSRNYVAALDQLTTAQEEEAAAVEQATEEVKKQQEAVAELTAQTPAIGLYMAALSDGATRNTTNLAGLATSLADAGVSGEELQAVLAGIGANASPQAAAAIEAIGATIIGLRDAAAGTLPTLQDIAGAADEFSLTGFRDELQNAYDAVVNFNTNLQTIAAQGGPRLAAAAAELGPQYAQAIADGLASGEPGVAAQVELLLAGIEGAGVDVSNTITGTIGPQLVTATGQMATGVSTAWAEGFVLDASGQITQVESQIIGGRPGVAFRASELGQGGRDAFHTTFTPDAAPGVAGAESGITAGAPGVAGAAGAAGTAGTGAFETNFTPDPGPAIEQARALVDRGAAAMAQAGFQLGDQAVRGFRAGTDAWSGVAAGQAVQAVSGVRAASGAASSAGYSVGSSLGAGIAEGIADWTSTIARNAVNAVNQAAAAARRAAQVSSPSKVFAEIGAQMGAGMAVGLSDAAGSVSAAAADLAAAAVTPVESAAVGVRLGIADVAPQALAGVSATAGAGTTVTVRVEAGAVVFNGPATSETVDTAGDRLGTVLARRLDFTARTGG